MTTQGTVSVTIEATPEDVWPWIGDITRHNQWSPKPYRVDLVSGEPNSAGSRYRSVGWAPPNDSDHVNDVEITVVQPPARFALTATDASGTYANSFDLRPVGDGTEVTYRIVFPDMGGIAANLLPILFRVVATPGIKKRMRLLKQAVESAK